MQYKYKRLQEETQRGEDAKNQLDELYKMKKFGYLDYTKMMDYLGEKATETDIDIITLSKVETRQNGKHYEVPYYVTLKGKYENLLMFVDSLYQIENYMQINAFQINQKASSEEKNGTTNDNSSNYEQWMNTFAQRLNKDLKTEKVKENTKR